MAHHVIEYDEQCKSCSGTGIYVGMAERDGAGVVCSDCKGAGCRHRRIEYDDFTGRVRRSDVVRVQRVNPGIVVDDSFDQFGGLPYDDWAAGAQFTPGTEDRKHTCPAWWYQCADWELKPHWDICDLGMFTSCKMFGCKADCWRRWDIEFGTPA